MSVIVRDDGFHAEDHADSAVFDIGHDTRPEALPSEFGAIDLIRVAFPSATDGRGFTLARHLRGKGFSGRLRASGHVLADQYTMARRSGFDEVEISDELASRQPADQWKFRADWRDHDYRSRLKA